MDSSNSPVKQGSKPFLQVTKSISNSLCIVIPLVLFLGVFTACTSGKSGDSTTADQKLSLGISRSLLSIPIYVAQEKGFFAEAGLDMKITEFSSGKLATQAMFSDEVDLATMADTPLVSNAFKRDDFSVVAIFTTSYHFVRLLTRDDQDIVTATDLKGKKIGINQNTSSHFFLAAFLIDNGIPVQDVCLVHYPTPKLAEALLSGEVDAAALWQPYAANAIMENPDILGEMPADEVYRTTFCFGAKNHFISDHKARLVKFLGAVNKAGHFIEDNPEESKLIITNVFGLDLQTVNSIWDDYHFHVSLDQALLIGLEDIARWMIENQTVTSENIPDFSSFIDNEVLDSLDPNLNTIIHEQGK